MITLTITACRAARSQETWSFPIDGSVHSSLLNAELMGGDEKTLGAREAEKGKATRKVECNVDCRGVLCQDVVIERSTSETRWWMTNDKTATGDEACYDTDISEEG
jgi:hypothetical protein